MKKLFIASAMFALPVVSFASPLDTTIANFAAVVTALLPIMLALAVLVFFWGLVKYIANASDEAAKESGKTLMIWGMVALFVMVALWGIIGYVQESLGLSGTITTTPPPAFVVPTT